MKQGIHPDYILGKVHCACGHTFEVYRNKGYKIIALGDMNLKIEE